jgi:hypothetical protein
MMNYGKQAKIVIIVDFLKNDYRNVIPVALSLAKKGFCCKIIASDRKQNDHLLKKVAENNCLSYGFLDDFINVRKKHYLNKIVKIYKAKLKYLNSSLKEAEVFLFNSFSLLNTEYQDFSNLIGVMRVKDILRGGIGLKEMLDTEMPDLLVFSDEQSALGKLYALIAKSRRIPFLCLPDLSDQLLQNLPILEPEKESRYGVFGRGVQKALRRQGLAVRRFIQIGSPLADAYCANDSQLTKEEILVRLNLKKNKGLFLFTMQNSLPENEPILQALILAMRAFPNNYLIVRPHPVGGHERGCYALVKAGGVNNVIVSKRFNINDLISASEMVIVVYSLSGFLAIIKNKPLISINLSPFPDNMPYAEYGAALGVYNVEDIPQAMKNVLHNRSVRNKLRAGRKRLLRDYPARNLDIAKARARDLAISLIK